MTFRLKPINSVGRNINGVQDGFGCGPISQRVARPARIVVVSAPFSAMVTIKNRHQSNSLKSSALTVGFERLAGRCLELEKSCLDGAFAHARKRTDGLGDCLAEAEAALENEPGME